MALHPALAALLTQTVLHAPYTGQDGYGASTYGPAVTREASIQYDVRQIPTPQGEQARSMTLVFLNGNAPVGARDKLTLPDGTSPAIQQLVAVMDVDGHPSHYEVRL
jgi:hypothetical protein